MSEETTATMHRVYDLVQARRYPSTREPASHQSEALGKLHAWFGKKHIPAGGILVLPTGGGKTFVAVRFLCAGPLSQGYKILWLAHTHHLLEQAFYSFAPRDSAKAVKTGYEIARIAEAKSRLSIRVVSGTPGHFPVHQIKPDDDVIIGTLQTITAAYNDPNQLALKAFLGSTNGKLMIVFDEAHHAPAPSYRKLIESLRHEYPALCLLGLTATPTYTDEKKQGWLTKLFPQKIIYQVSPQKLIADKILAKPILEESTTQYTPDFDEREYQKWTNSYQDLPERIIEQLASNRDRNNAIVSRYVADRERYGKTIIFADRWYQCEQLREMLRQRGIRADVVYSHVDADPGSFEARARRVRDENGIVLDAFRQNKLDVLINVRLLTEGTDVPDVQTVFLTRQTTSRILLTQMVGRALRGPRFGGTDVAYIVAFTDHWKQIINWAGYDQLSVGMADDAFSEYGKRPPLQLISIELVRQLARQLDSGLNVTPGPFLSLMPIGWYQVGFEAVVEGSNDTETVRQLAMVFENQEESYVRFIQQLTEADLQAFSSEKLDVAWCQIGLDEWKVRFFPQNANEDDGNLSTNLLYIVRHMAQNDGEPPAFFLFGERDNHDLDKLAKLFSIDEDLGAKTINESLKVEYSRSDRYWQAIYYSYLLFKSQYDACVNRLLELHNTGGEVVDPIFPSVGGSLLSREPTPLVKAQVKARDHYTCLCCGDNRKICLQIDHIAPAYYGGNNSLDNLQTLCRACNQNKGINTQNFRTNRTFFAKSPATFGVLGLPKDAGSREEWSRMLCRSINFFYGCAAVQTINIGKRGEHFHEWHVSLYTGNDPRWLQPHIKDLVQKINAVRQGAGLMQIRGVKIGSPDQADVS